MSLSTVPSQFLTSLRLVEQTLSALILDPVFDNPRFLRPCFRLNRSDIDDHPQRDNDDNGKVVPPSIPATSVSLPRTSVRSNTHAHRSDDNSCIKTHRQSSAHLDQNPSSDCFFTSSNDVTPTTGSNSVETLSQQHDQSKLAPRSCVNPHDTQSSTGEGGSHDSQFPSSVDEPCDAQPHHCIGKAITEVCLRNPRVCQSTDTAGRFRPSRSRRVSEAYFQVDPSPSTSKVINERDAGHPCLERRASVTDGGQGHERSKRARRSTVHSD